CAFGALAALTFALLGPGLAGLLPPATATRLLVAGNVAVAGATLLILGLMASTAVAQLPLVARAGDWSTQVMRETDPVPIWVGVCCGLLLVPAASLGLRAMLARARAMLEMHR